MHNRVIDGRFELMERLGGGGMGLVWRARDVALHREVALKEVRPPDPSMEEHDPTRARELRARVLREARALARLNHPHVATIHHIVDPGEQGYPWIVMELVTGGSLQDRLQRGPLTPAEAARLGREVLSALRAAHAVGIQHRDVKPANVLLREDGRSVLTDFGIAAVRESTSLTATGSFIGSPEYMAPERINGHEGDPASDLWSLGMLLYVAVEGRHPLRRSTTLATLAAVLNQDVPPPERAGPLGPVLQALLRRDPAARPDAETLDRLLASATGSGPGTFPPAPPSPAAHAAPQPPPWAPHATPQPSPWGPAPISQAKTVRSQRPGRVATNVGIAISVAALVVAGVLVWRFLPATTTTVTGGDPTARNVTPAASSNPETPAASSDPETPAETETGSSEPENLLTPAGMKAMIAKVEKEIGGSKIVSMTVYPTYASISAPVKTDKEVYDMYFYRDGAVARSSNGGVVDGPLVDLDKYNWNALPGLIKTANKDLGVPEPTTRYVIVDPDTTSGTPVLRVYVSDDHNRTGYLVANLQGKVVRTYRHE
ncbi:protein kinase-like protein [Nonomuraea polychroma]|uniref:non-specific serine/threonine protein kinase n=1 Tax=Nonomuraea polychroma TaxID=46176 RepID=A0A438MF05_9ACTN|nr:serine/threonine-protein kinase [Nonomuraea polychroma]RVX44115.1 protein kinase-like protein [Nonomuraea polychroma]